MTDPSIPPRVNGHDSPPPVRRVNGVARDPSHITSHAFVPRAEWWTTCKLCGLAQAAHAKTTVPSGGDRPA